MAAGDIYYQNAALHLNFVTNLMLFDLFWGVQDINNNIAAVGVTIFNTAISAWDSYFGTNFASRWPILACSI